MKLYNAPIHLYHVTCRSQVREQEEALQIKCLLSEVFTVRSVYCQKCALTSSPKYAVMVLSRSFRKCCSISTCSPGLARDTTCKLIVAKGMK